MAQAHRALLKRSCAHVRVTWWRRGRMLSCSSRGWTLHLSWKKKRKRSSIPPTTPSPGFERCRRTLLFLDPPLFTLSRMESTYQFVPLFYFILLTDVVSLVRCHFTKLELRVTPLLSEQAETVQTVPEESRAEGNIGLKLYLQYLRSGANVVVLLVVLLFNIVAQVCGETQLGALKSKCCYCCFLWQMTVIVTVLQLAYIMQDWWLAHWWV